MAAQPRNELDTATGIPDANYPLMSVQDAGRLIENTLVAYEGVNGPNQFSTESAAYGYIARHLRVVIPRNLYDLLRGLTRDSFTDNPMPGNFINPVQNLTIMYWNFVRLVNGGVNREQAFFVAAYRARLIYLGYLYPDRADRAVTIDEVDFWEGATDFHSAEADFPIRAIAEQGERGTPGYRPAVAQREGNAYGRAYNAAADDNERIAAYYAHGNDQKFKRFISYAMTEANLAVLKHISFSAQQYAAMTYLVFRQHGHHYKTDFDAKYNVLWKATTIDSSPRYPGNEMIHRNAIHSFGVKILHQKFFQNINNQKLAETFVDRQDVAPAGTAVIATCHAAIELMKALPIWDQMYMAYKPQIDALAVQAKKLKDAARAIRYHKNARLFGEQRFELNAEVAHALAPIAKGFIESLGPEADLSKQKALDKRAQQNPLIASLVASVIDKVTRQIARSGDISAFTKGEMKKKVEAAGTGATITEVEEEEEEEEESEEGEEEG